MNMDLKDEIIQRVVKERLGEPNGIYKRHIHQDLVKEMMEQYHQSKVNNGVLDDVIVSHLKALTKMIEDSHNYGFEDVLEEYLNSL
tara:strand:+ start:373 stop:630 length:258 start_codon:yes stop_codon:yes gene_type:complete